MKLVQQAPAARPASQTTDSPRLPGGYCVRKHIGAMSIAICIALAWCLLASLSTFAHDRKNPPPMALLPACRVAANTCSLADLSRRDWGIVRTFPVPIGTVASRLDLDSQQLREQFTPLADIPCTNGFADIYRCKNVDLLAFMPLSTFNDTSGNTLWGWTDPLTLKEYVLVGLSNGTAFVDISTPTAPRYLGKLPTQATISRWRDMKVYENYAFIVSDFNPGHGMQVFDLTRLRTITATVPLTFSADAQYSGFNNSHNIVINEQSGFAYAVGTELQVCSSGMHIIDIRQPLTPTEAGCYKEDGYVHDAQCVIYHGPDKPYQGKELCFNASVNKLTVVDVTDKAAIQRTSVITWDGIGYVHQVWLTEDHAYLLLDDEMDEQIAGHKARTYIFDMRDLEKPVLIGTYTSRESGVDHNLYISGTYAFQANYTAGLRILEISDIASANLREVAYFDTYPGSNALEFTGAWSPYPFFASGVVAVSTIDRGLFLLKPQIPSDAEEDHYLFLPLATFTMQR